MPRARLTLASVAAALALVLAACGSPSHVAPRVLPGAKEPDDGPALTSPPPGAVLALPADSDPEGLVVDSEQGIVAVALRHPDRLALVDARTMRLIRVETVPASARHLELAAPTGPLLLPGEDTGKLVEVALPSGAVTAQIPVGKQPHDATAADGRIFVAVEFGSEVAVVAGDRVTADLRGPVQPGGVAATAGVVAAVDVRGALLYLWDTATLKLLGTVPIGAGPSHVVAVGPGLLLAADTRGNQVLLVDVQQRRVVSRLSLSDSPYGLAADPDGGRAFVALSGSNAVVTVSVTGGVLRELSRTSTPQTPFSVAYDDTTGCLFVAGNADALLQRTCP